MPVTVATAPITPAPRTSSWAAGKSPPRPAPAPVGHTGHRERRWGHLSVADHRAAVPACSGGSGRADRPRPACRGTPPRRRPRRARRPPPLRRLAPWTGMPSTRPTPGQRRYPVVGDVPAGSAPQAALAAGRGRPRHDGRPAAGGHGRGRARRGHRRQPDRSGAGAVVLPRRPDRRPARAVAWGGRAGRIAPCRSGIRGHGGPGRARAARRGARRSRCDAPPESPSSRRAPSWRRPTSTPAPGASTSPTPTWSPPSPQRPGARCAASRCAPTSPTSCATCWRLSTPTRPSTSSSRRAG